MANVLLTGNRGYLGSFVHHALMERGYNVVGVDSEWFLYPHTTDSKLVSQITKEDVENCDCVISLAWFSSAGDDLIWLQEKSLEETKWVVDCCEKTGTKLVFASTASVYGYQDLSVLCDEETTLSPVCAYGRTKLAAELYIEGNLSPELSTIFRKGTLMGKGFRKNRTRLDLVVNAFLKTALTEGVIKVWQPECVRPLLHVQDAAEAYVQAVEGAIEPGIYNLAHKNYTIIALAHWVANMLEKRPQVEVEFGGGDGSARSYQITANKAIEAGVSVGKGVADVIREFEDTANVDWLFDLTMKNVVWMKKVLQMSKWISKVEVPDDGDN